ncbi:response regulator transcription factor [Paractinoplanes lichenicola]|uniref:Response regulator transcription factor n=1 Tax=Paractinoplanes lichenicola TaxID=2802976 RepID=A0ABS1VIK0_9ACTN|nr:response regulator transcription factor [Actinoplanes lichenicola]MBL7253291.1 response regulator transcription factor [Actinoplanes lichenicola]
MIAVLVADDEELNRAFVKILLTREPDMEVVAEAVDGREAIDLSRRHRPDVVLMDLRMAVMDGIAATKVITGPDLIPGDPYHPRVAVLTISQEDGTVAEALRAGASGYLLKHCVRSGAIGHLATGIREIAGGGCFLHPAVTGAVIAAAASVAPEPGPPSPSVLDRLTPRELEILEHMARGYENGEIAARLFLSQATVRTHVSRVIMKLGVHGRTQAVVAAYQNRLLPAGPP